MDFITRYRQPSLIETQTSLVLVFMAATELGEERRTDAAVPAIFSGQLAQPLIFRNLLLGLRNTVESRFYRPDLWRLLDPVITSGNQLLRLECFSSCASVYARADFTENAFADGAFHRNGTTNVDFNGAFLNHLAQLRPGKPAHFEMGEQSIKLQSQGEAVEHKVKLPERWIKGFLQVQAVQRQAQPLFELDRLTAGQLLARIPASSKGALIWSRSATSRKSSIASPPVRAGSSRSPTATGCGCCKPSCRICKRCAFIKPRRPARRCGWRTPARPSSRWDCRARRPTASPATATRCASCARRRSTRSIWRWPAPPPTVSTISPSPNWPQHQNLPLPHATEIVDWLAQQGLLGFDRDRDRYFYRQLPFLVDAKNQPGRLQGSQKLLEKQSVEIEHPSGATAS